MAHHITVVICVLFALAARITICYHQFFPLIDDFVFDRCLCAGIQVPCCAMGCIANFVKDGAFADTSFSRKMMEGVAAIFIWGFCYCDEQFLLRKIVIVR